MWRRSSERLLGRRSGRTGRLRRLRGDQVGINGWSEALRVELQPDVRVIVIVRPEGFKKLPANGAIELSGSETAVPRGHSRALSDVPSSGASAGRIRLVHADSSRL
jgi:hypothetical protein